MGQWIFYAVGSCCCLLIALAVVVLLVIVARKLLRPDAAEKAWIADAETPFKCWAQGAFFALTSNQDYAYLSDGQVRVMLEDAWDIKDAEGMEAMIAQMEQAQQGVWDLVRAMLLTRSAVAVEFMDDDASWERVKVQCQMLQQMYDSWDQQAEHLVAFRRDWLGVPTDGSADDDSMQEVLDDIETARKEIWPDVPFKETDLS